MGSKRERERTSVMCTQVSVGEFMYSMSTFMIICCDLQQHNLLVKKWLACVVLVNIDTICTSVLVVR